MPRIFVDTNVLIYVRDMRDLRKRKIAQDWIGALTDREIVVVNLQVLNELANWMLKRGQAVEAPRIRASVEALREWGAEPLERADVGWAVRICCQRICPTARRSGGSGSSTPSPTGSRRSSDRTDGPWASSVALSACRMSASRPFSMR
jgi:predicted nucleic acid-binding protein